MPSGKSIPLEASEFREEPRFSQNRKNLYDYYTYVKIRLPESDFGPTGIHMTAKLEISPYENRTYLMKVVSINITEVTGAQPRNRSTPATKLTQALTDYFAEPIMFEYQSNGNVGDIYAPRGASGTSINLYKGILDMLNVKIKKNQNVYNLQEFRVGGVCNTRYVVPQQEEGDQLIVEKSIDFNNCQDKVSEKIGMAFMDYCKSCQKLHRNIRNSVISTIKLKKNVIQEVVSKQIIDYTPIQGHIGTAIMEAEQVLTRTGTRSNQSNSPRNRSRTQRNLQTFPDEISQIHFALLKSGNLKAQVEQIIQQMVQNNQEKIHQDEKLMKLIELLHHASPEILHAMWSQYSQKAKHRTWFLQGLRLAGSEDSLKFTQQIFQSGELTDREAAAVIPVAIHVTRGSQQALQISKELIEDPKVQGSPILYKFTVLSYGSMVNKYCLHLSICPDSALKPLHNLAEDALSKVDEQQIRLALKAIGNAGQAKSIKHIRTFLPGFFSSADQLPVRNKVDAVMALRNVAKQESREPLHNLTADGLRRIDKQPRSLAFGNASQTQGMKRILKFLPGFFPSADQLPVRSKVDTAMALRNLAKQDPREVQQILMQVYTDQKVQNEARMMASLTLLETKPDPAMVTNIANVAVRESKENPQLASFVYSQTKALFKSLIHLQEPRAAAYNDALKLFNPIIDNLGYGFSKVISMDTFKYPFMSGTAVKVYMMNKPNGQFPSFVIGKLRGFIADEEVVIAEVGVRAEEHTQLPKRQDIQSDELSNHKNISENVNLLKVRREQPVLHSTYMKLFDQEMSLTETHEPTMQTQLRVRREQPVLHSTYMKLFDQEMSLTETHEPTMQTQLKVRREQPVPHSTYMKLFDQELSFTETHEPTMQTQALNESAESYPIVKNITNKLMDGLIHQFTSAVEDVEAHHIIPTIVGLPIKISWKATAVGNAPISSIKVDDQITPSKSPDLYIAQLLDSQISEDLNTREVGNRKY